MGEKERMPASVPFQSHQADMARMERANHRSFILNLILAILLTMSWAGFVIYERQFETVTETTFTQEVSQDADGGNNHFVGGDYYGEADG